MPKHNVKPMRVEPTEDGQRLRIVWKDGHTSEYVPRQIRLACPCAGCVDEFTGKPLLDPASVPEDIMPVAINYVGGYALAFKWPDGHDTGIYPYDLLRRLCPCDECAARREAEGQPDDRARFLRMEHEDDDGADPSSGGAPGSGDEAAATGEAS
ncbi:MAG: DUF971 domain-containing protein [Longimicrobiales bacterium]